ncbi:F-box only protein 32 [Trichinella spiralis]|uniref:F-box only protein 32 n=1 Tax=Trichinella spiralis TaxID=6334 RepID=UPI0001EFD185|nr:F-box only protein 32 [Trichinella spiralis]
MPFIGKDWRSYGDTWVPTRGGWEKKKLIPGRQISKTESSLERFLRFLMNSFRIASKLI